MYLWKCEEYSGGEIISANENNQLCNGLLLFMIVLLLYDRFQSDLYKNIDIQYNTIKSPGTENLRYLGIQKKKKVGLKGLNKLENMEKQGF